MCILVWLLQLFLHQNCYQLLKNQTLSVGNQHMKILPQIITLELLLPFLQQYLMINKQFLILFLSITALSALKLQPLKLLNETSFKTTIGCDLESFLSEGCHDNKIWFLLFKIPNCQYCQQASILFFNTYIEYNKRFFLHERENQLESNLMFAEVDCQQSGAICDRFNVPHYPYFNIVEENGDACHYKGGVMPNEIIEYLSQRKQGKPYEKCTFLGKITFWSKFLAYAEPITKFMNYNTMLFLIAFVIGPFLFGFVFSRNRRNKEEEVPSVQGNNKPQKSQ